MNGLLAAWSGGLMFSPLILASSSVELLCKMLSQLLIYKGKLFRLSRTFDRLVEESRSSPSGLYLVVWGSSFISESISDSFQYLLSSLKTSLYVTKYFWSLLELETVSNSTTEGTPCILTLYSSSSLKTICLCFTLWLLFYVLDYYVFRQWSSFEFSFSAGIYTLSSTSS